MKSGLLFCFFLIVLSRSFGQKNEVGLQYSYSISSPNALSGTNEIDVYPDEMSVSAIRGNLGSGNSLGINYYRQTKNEHIYLGLLFSKFIGNQTLFYHYDRNNLYQNIEGNSSRYELQPGVKFVVPCKKITFNMFSGLLVPLSNKSVIYYTEKDFNSNVNTDFNEEFSYNFSFGFTQQIGFEKNISDKLKIHGSLNYLLFSETTHRKTLNDYIVNGVDQTDQLNVYDKETVYQQNLSNFSNNETYNGNYNVNFPKDELIISHNFSSISFLISLSYRF